MTKIRSSDLTKSAIYSIGNFTKTRREKRPPAFGLDRTNGIRLTPALGHRHGPAGEAQSAPATSGGWRGDKSHFAERCHRAVGRRGGRRLLLPGDRGRRIRSLPAPVAGGPIPGASARHALLPAGRSA